MSRGRIAEDPTSYASTGIPRGDPRRYESHGVMRMGLDRNVKTKDQRLEMPQEDIETEGDRQLKKLLEKQLNTHVTIDSELGKRKNFQASSSYVRLESKLTGALTYEEYRKLSEEDRYREELRACGLTEEEIDIKAVADGLNVKKRKIGTEESVLQDRLSEIDQKIKLKKDELSKPDKFAGRKYMSRQEYDLEQAISHDQEKVKLLSCLMTNERPDAATRDPKDPINNLEDIWGEMRHHAKEEVKKKRRRRKQKKKNVEDEEEDEVYGEEFVGPLPRDLSNASAFKLCEDQDEIPLIKDINVSINSSAEKVNSDDKTIEDTPIEIIPEEAIIRYRLTTDQIKEMPRFKDYHPGQPSKVLYLKNLSEKVTQNDLIALFGRYDTVGHKVQCKLLRGRMRGQAFVTFHDNSSAEQALLLVNGYDFKGKPIVIQFGHKG